MSTNRRPATDLGYLLHKHPDRVQSFEESAGVARVFYPQASDQRCTAALLLEVDPVALVRRRATGDRAEALGHALGQYVNDRPYAASSLLALAIKHVFATAMAGRCTARPELAATSIPLELRIPTMPCRGGADLARRLFEPLGWTVQARPIPLDPAFPLWGASPYLDTTLRGTVRLADALNHLYVLLPVLDDAKHYWVGIDEVDKLVRAGTGWLAAHPEKAVITRRYLAHRSELTRSALARLAEVDDLTPEQVDDAVGDAVGEAVDAGIAGDPAEPRDRRVPLAEQRRGAVLAAIRASRATTVADLGCGEGALTRDLLADPGVRKVFAVDVSVRALQHTARRVRLERMGEKQRERIEIFQSALTYRDERLAGLDAAVLMEVIEHVDPPRLGALERTVFAEAAPGTVVVTTPNVEYNVRFETLPAGTRRHRDHRFEWSRAQFRAWCDAVAGRHGYTVRFLPVGPDDAEVGAPTQLAVFTRREAPA